MAYVCKNKLFVQHYAWLYCLIHACMHNTAIYIILNSDENTWFSTTTVLILLNSLFLHTTILLLPVVKPTSSHEPIILI